MEHISKNETAGCLPLKELCKELSISIATGRNWVKLGKLSPSYTEHKTPYFAKTYVERLKNELKSGSKEALKSRRNKTYISGTSLYHSYVSESSKNIPAIRNILSAIEEGQLDLSVNAIPYIVADCALHLFSIQSRLHFDGQKNLLSRYLAETPDNFQYRALVDSLIGNKEAALNFCQCHPQLFSFDYYYEPGEDILGLIYLSCKNLKNRKAAGIYYTPINIVKTLISSLNIKGSQKLLDPGCGTGNFLLQLPETVPFHNIYGNDLDTVSVKIARLNMALKYPDESMEDICLHITESDYLTEYAITGFDYIIGNPPWGYHFSERQKQRLRGQYLTASRKNMESYDLFVERSLASLTAGGQLSFVLPEAILNVKSHKEIRKLMCKGNSIQRIEFLGDAFDGVHCPSIILQITNTGKPLSTIGLEIKDKSRSFTIMGERAASPEYFNFTATDAEYAVLEKIKSTKNTATLAGNAYFALGIVTGNNKEYLSSEKTAENEVVLKGSDIRKYHIKQPNYYIYFKPENFQQTAPTRLYRAPEKLLYRFICNQLVFAYDANKTLSLNSCNIVIPTLENVKIKYILAILNSRVAQFLFQKEFHSVKVLRSHIEAIPIPVIDEAIQDDIISITNLLIQGMAPDHAKSTYEILDKRIFELFQLTPMEQGIIKSAVDGTNKFLY